MDAAVNRFVCLLKRNGVRTSPSESIDAMQALRCVTLADRETAKTALRTALIKDMHDIGVFDELFELFFGLPTRSRPFAHGHDHHHEGEQAEPDRIVFDEEDRGVAATDGEHAHGEPVPIRDFFEPEMMVTRFNPHQDPNQLSLSALSQGLLLNRNKGLLDKVMKRVTHQINVRRVKNIAKPGELNFGDGFLQLDEDLLVNAAEALLEDLRDLDVDENLINQLARRIDGMIVNLPELLKRYIEREMALQRGHDPQQEPVRSAYRYRFSESERRQMEEIIRRLGRRMRGARSYRRVVTHRGRIHVARTLRNSMVYDGIPFKPVLTSQRNERPRIVVICDVSLSVRNTARFTLHLVYSLQSLFEQVRSFVFVSDLADASAYFEQGSIDDAIAAIFSGELHRLRCQQQLRPGAGDLYAAAPGHRHQPDDGDRPRRRPRQSQPAQCRRAGGDPAPRKAAHLVVARAARQLGPGQLGHAPLCAGLSSRRGGPQSIPAGRGGRFADPSTRDRGFLWLRSQVPA